MNLDEFNRLKKKAVKAKEDRDKAEGGLESIMKRIKDEFGLDTIDEAEARLAELTREEKELDEQATAALREFEQKWQEKL